MAERYAQYVNDPAKLVDILDFVIKKLLSRYQGKATVDQALQLSEISKAISRLNDSGAKVPDELRKMKIGLSVVVTEQENTLKMLQTIEIRLSHTMTDLRASIKRLKDPIKKTKTRKRYVKRTSPTLLRKAICKALRELGGSAKKSDVIEKIRENMDGKFKPKDLEQDSKRTLNWEKWVVQERSKMIKEGVLKTGINQRLWELRRK